MVKVNNWINKVATKPTKSKPIQLIKKDSLSKPTLECNTFDRQELLKILRELRHQDISAFDGKKKENPDTTEIIMKYNNQTDNKRDKNKQNTIEAYSKKPLGNLEENSGLSKEISSTTKQDDSLIPKYLRYDQKRPVADSAKHKIIPNESILNDIKQQEKQLVETKEAKTDHIKEIVHNKKVMDEKDHATTSVDNKSQIQKNEESSLDSLGSYKKIIDEAQIKTNQMETSKTMPKDSTVSLKKTEKVADDKQSQSINKQYDQIARFLQEIQALGSKKEPKKVDKDVEGHGGEDMRLLLSKKVIDEESKVFDKQPKRSITKYMKNYLKYIIPPATTNKKVTEDGKKYVGASKKVVKPQSKPHLDVFEPLNENDDIKNYFLEVQEAFRLLLSKKIVDDEAQPDSTVSKNIDSKKSDTDTKQSTGKYLDEQESLTSNISIQNVVDIIDTTLGQYDKSKSESNSNKAVTIESIDNERFTSAVADEKNQTKILESDQAHQKNETKDLQLDQLHVKEGELNPSVDILKSDKESTENFLTESKKFIHNDFRLLLSKKILDDEALSALAEHEIKSNIFVIEDIIERSFLTPGADIEETVKSDVTYDQNNGSVKLIGTKEFEMISLEMLTQSVREIVDDLMKQNDMSLVTKSKDDENKKGPKSGLPETTAGSMLDSSVLQQHSRSKEENDATKKDTKDTSADKPNTNQFHKLETAKDEATTTIINPSNTIGNKNATNLKIIHFIKTNIIKFMVIKAMQDAVLVKSIKIIKDVPRSKDEETVVLSKNENSLFSVFKDWENGILRKNTSLKVNPTKTKKDLLNHFMLIKYLLKPKVSIGPTSRKGRISRNYSTNDSGSPLDNKSKKSEDNDLKKMSNCNRSETLQKYWIASFLNSRGLCDTMTPSEDKRNTSEHENNKEIEAKPSRFEDTNTPQLGKIESENGNEKLPQNEWSSRIAPSSSLCSKINNDNDDQHRSSLVISSSQKFNGNINPIEANCVLAPEETTKGFVIVDSSSTAQHKPRNFNVDVIMLGSGKSIADKGKCAVDDNMKTEVIEQCKNLNLSNTFEGTTCKNVEETTTQKSTLSKSLDSHESFLENEKNSVPSDANSCLDFSDSPEGRLEKINELIDILLSKLDNKSSNDSESHITRIKNDLLTLSTDNPNNKRETRINNTLKTIDSDGKTKHNEEMNNNFEYCNDSPMENPVKDIWIESVKTELGKGLSKAPKSVVPHKNKKEQLMLVPQDDINVSSNVNCDSSLEFRKNASNDLYRQLIKGFIESEITEKACKDRTCLKKNDLNKRTNKIAVGKFPVKNTNNEYYRKDENRLLLFRNKSNKTSDAADSIEDTRKNFENEDTDSGFNSLQDHSELSKISKNETMKECTQCKPHSREDIKILEKRPILYNEPVKENKVIGQSYMKQRGKFVHEYLQTAKNTAFNKVVELSDYLIITNSKRRWVITSKIINTRPNDKNSVIKARRRAGKAVQRYFSIKHPKKNKSNDDTGPNSPNSAKKIENNISLLIKKLEERYTQNEAKLLEKNKKLNSSSAKAKLSVKNVQMKSEKIRSETPKGMNELKTNVEVKKIEKDDKTKAIIEVKASLPRKRDNISASELRVATANKQRIEKGQAVSFKIGQNGNVIVKKIDETSSSLSYKKDSNKKVEGSKLSHIETVNPKTTVKSRGAFTEELLKHDEKLHVQDITNKNKQEQQQEHKNKSELDDIFASFLIKKDSSVSEIEENQDKTDDMFASFLTKKKDSSVSEIKKNRDKTDDMFASFLTKKDSSVSEIKKNRDKTDDMFSSFLIKKDSSVSKIEENRDKTEDDITLAEEFSLSNDDTKSHQTTPVIVKSTSQNSKDDAKNVESRKTKISELVNSSLEKSKELNLPIVMKPDSYIRNLANKKSYTKNILRLPGFFDILRLKPCNVDNPSLNLQKPIMNKEYDRLTNLVNLETDYSNDLYCDYLTSGRNFSDFLSKTQRSGSVYENFIKISTMAQMALYNYARQGINDLYPTNSSLIYKSLQSIAFQNFVESRYNTKICKSIQNCNNFYQNCFNTLKCLYNNYSGLWEFATIPQADAHRYDNPHKSDYTKLKCSLDNDRRNEFKKDEHNAACNYMSKVSTPNQTLSSQKHKETSKLDEDDEQITTTYLDCLSRCSNESGYSEYHSLEAAAILPEPKSHHNLNKNKNKLQESETKTDIKIPDISKKPEAERRKEESEENLPTGIKEPSSKEGEKVTVPFEDFQIQMSINVGSQRQRKEIVRKTLTAMTLKLTEIASPVMNTVDDSQNELEDRQFVRNPQNDLFIDQISNVSLIKVLDDGEINNTKASKPKPLRVKPGLNIGTFVTSDGNIAYKLESCRPKDQRKNVYNVFELCLREIERKEKLYSLTSLRPSTLMCCGINPTSNGGRSNYTPQ
ncbi:uncharacterized protein LOC108742503 isoform X3 [Agrilus planipennis]|nr:uncharacterized protein LOC108742503 isoform X3 [Agrilus planipennis]